MEDKSKSNLEIERKFLVGDAPTDLSRHQQTGIAQGYLAVSGKDELRIRKRGGDYTLTVKRGAGRDREEEEVDLSEGLYEALWPTTDGRRIYKVRYEIPFQGNRRPIELDVYEGELLGLKVAEIEFDSKAEADDFSPPAWLGREITDDPTYKNQALAGRTSPP